MDDQALEKVYQEGLEERIIDYLVTTKQWSYEQTMDVYYKSDLAEKIHQGTEGIQYLDYKVLAQILLEAATSQADDVGMTEDDISSAIRTVRDRKKAKR